MTDYIFLILIIYVILKAYCITDKVLIKRAKHLPTPISFQILGSNSKLPPAAIPPKSTVVGHKVQISILLYIGLALCAIRATLLYMHTG